MAHRRELIQSYINIYSEGFRGLNAELGAAESLMRGIAYWIQGTYGDDALNKVMKSVNDSVESKRALSTLECAEHKYVPGIQDCPDCALNRLNEGL